jgi:hypothetical protein
MSLRSSAPGRRRAAVQLRALREQRTGQIAAR